LTRRVVATGVGLVSALGVGTEETWKNILAGKSGVGPITHFDTAGFSATIAAEVKGFDPFLYVEKKEVKKMGLFIQYAMAATQFAIELSGLKISPETAERVGVYIGSGIGGFDVIEREHKALLNGGPRRISPFFIPAGIVNLAAGFVSIRWGAKGPNSATCTACSSSAHAVGDSYKIIQRCDADVMICGGTEAAITPLSVGGFAAMRALSTRNAEPERASRPFDADRDGFIIGEGSGILILEELGHAVNRGATILAEVVGYGMSGDAFHITQPAEGGVGAILTSLAVRTQNLGWLPPIWLGCYGAAVTNGSIVSVPPVRYFGLALLATAAAAALTPENLGLAWLALGFGWLHLVFGAYIAWRHNG
jgi:3-oxoacyl-[acyl-carrier-protein] synthase II